jgi:hypothetical protein
VHTEASPRNSPDGERAARLRDFARRLQGLHQRRAAGHAAASALLVGAIPAIVALILLPSHRVVTLAWLGVFTAIVAVHAALRARRIAGPALLGAVDGTTGLEAFGDELATWLEFEPEAARDAMVPWLGRLVETQVPQLPPAALQRVGRRRFGRLRHLLPAIVLLLLAWLLLEWIQPPWPGVLGGKPEPTRAAPGPGDAAASAAGPGAVRSMPDTTPPPPQGQRPDAPAPPPSSPNGEPPPPPAAPAPLLDLPTHLHFTVPEHIGDGPTRKVSMHAAEQPEPAGVAPPRPPQPTAAGGETQELPAPPPPSAASFERAAEAALRARHVPKEEQPMVRRFFELLQKAGR